MAAANNERVRVRVCKSYHLSFLNPHTLLQGLSIFRPIIYGNTATVLTTAERDDLVSPDHTHRWTVAVRSAASLPESDEVGGADDLSYFIKRVTFKLHETYPNPSRSVFTPPTHCQNLDFPLLLQILTSLHLKLQKQGMYRHGYLWKPTD